MSAHEIVFNPDARALRKLQRMSHGAIAALCQPTPGGFDVVTTSRKDFDNLQSIKKAN